MTLSIYEGGLQSPACLFNKLGLPDEQMPRPKLLRNNSFPLQEIFGYKTQGWRRTLCIAGYILSCGALLLLFYWKPEWDVWANCIRCSLEEADIVLLRTTVGAYFHL